MNEHVGMLVSNFNFENYLFNLIVKIKEGG